MEKLSRGATKLMLPKCGDNVNIERNATFSIRTEIGNNSGIGVNAHFYGKVVIGDNVMMAPDCIIYVRNHESSRLDIPMCEQGSTEERPVVIGNDRGVISGTTPHHDIRTLQQDLLKIGDLRIIKRIGCAGRCKSLKRTCRQINNRRGLIGIVLHMQPVYARATINRVLRLILQRYTAI